MNRDFRNVHILFGVVFDNEKRKISDLDLALQVTPFCDQIQRSYGYLEIYSINVFLVLSFAEFIKLRMLVFNAKTCGRDINTATQYTSALANFY